MTDAIPGSGVILKRGSDEIAEVKGISSLAFSSGVIDKTSFRSSVLREFCGSIVDGGAISFLIQFNYTLPTHVALFNDFYDQGEHDYSLTFPDSDTTALEFSAIVVGIDIVAELESAVGASIAMKISGTPSWE